MTTLAMIFMFTAVLSVIALAAWCYYQILKKPALNPERRTHQERSV